MLLRIIICVFLTISFFFGFRVFGRYMTRKGLYERWNWGVIIIIYVISAVCFFFVINEQDRNYVTLFTIPAVSGWSLSAKKSERHDNQDA